MDPIEPDDVAPIALCPLEVLGDVIDAFFASTQAFTDELGGSPYVSVPLGRSLSHAVEANGNFVRQLFRVAAVPAQSSAGQRRRPEDAAAGVTRAVVLEAAAGAEASGSFELQNMGSEAVDATILPTAFVDTAGDEAAVELRLAPRRAMLEPGEAVLVSVTATVPGNLAAGQRLRGAVLVPDLTDSVVTVVIQSAGRPGRRSQAAL